jgi:hypothetical protein
MTFQTILEGRGRALTDPRGVDGTVITEYDPVLGTDVKGQSIWISQAGDWEFS